MKAIHAMTFGLALVIPEGLRADTLGVLAVSPPPNPTPELVEIATQLRSALAERSPAVLEPQQLRERISDRRSRISLTELDRAYESARSAYAKGDNEGSIRILRDAVETLEKQPDSGEAYKQWTRALLRLARAEADLGRYDEERLALDRLLRADPVFKVDSSLYSSRFVRDIEEARARIRSAPTQRLVVNALVEDVRVYVDGREIGSVPVTVTLPCGRHKVSGVRGAEQAPPVQVELGDAESLVILDPSLLDSLRPGAGPGLVIAGGARDLRILAAGALLKLDVLVTVSFAEERGVSYVVGTSYDVKRGALRREGRVPLEARALPPGGAAALADFLVTGQQSSNLVQSFKAGADGKAPDLRVLPPGTDFRFQREGLTVRKSKTLGWVAFGTGVGAVVLGGVAIWQAASSSSSSSEAQRLVQPDGSRSDQARYDALMADSDSSRKRAIAAGIGAGVCAVATGILGYLAYQQTGEVGPFRF